MWIQFWSLIHKRICDVLDNYYYYYYYYSMILLMQVWWGKLNVLHLLKKTNTIAARVTYNVLTRLERTTVLPSTQCPSFTSTDHSTKQSQLIHSYTFYWVGGKQVSTLNGTVQTQRDPCIFISGMAVQKPICLISKIPRSYLDVTVLWPTSDYMLNEKLCENDLNSVQIKDEYFSGGNCFGSLWKKLQRRGLLAHRHCTGHIIKVSGCSKNYCGRTTWGVHI